MKTKMSIFMGAFALLIATSAVFGSYQNVKTDSSLLTLNLEALAQEEDPNIVNGAYLKCSDGGIETIQCTTSGELSGWGVTISGSFTKNKFYIVPWERWSCEPLANNTCKVDEQGLEIGDIEESDD